MLLSARTRLRQPCILSIRAHPGEMNAHPLTLLTLLTRSRSQLARRTIESGSCELLIPANGSVWSVDQADHTGLQLGWATPKTCQRTNYSNLQAQIVLKLQFPLRSGHFEIVQFCNPRAIERAPTELPF